MIKTIILVFTSFLLLSSTITNAQEYYYWTNGEKYPIEAYPEKQYILIQGQKKSAIAESLDILERNISTIKPIIVSRTINNHRVRNP